MTGPKKRVIVFQRRLLHYRRGVFETIAASDEFDYTFCFGEGETNSGDGQAPAHPGFPSRFSRIWKWRLPGMKNPLFFQRAEIRAALGREFDVLIYWADLHFVSFAVGSIIARLRRKRVIHWGHGRSAGASPRNATWWLRRQIIKLAHVILLYGPRECEAYEKLGISRRKVFSCNNALDTRPARRMRSSLPKDDLTAFRRENGLGGGPVLIYIGRLEPRKKLHEMLAAMPIILREIPETKLVIIGDGSERSRLEERIGELAIDRSVLMVGAVHDEAVLARFFLISELAVCPGAVGLMANHAFAYGVPLVTNNDMWSHGPEIALLEPGATGEFFEAGDVKSLAQCVITMLRDRKGLKKMRQRCLQLIDEQYNEQVMAARFDDAVRHALAL